jgi:hypothetical protein
MGLIPSARAAYHRSNQDEGLRLGSIDGLHSTASGRFFAWVIGGALSAALDADWLTAAWDQNAYNYVTGPAAAVVEECEPQTACGH